MAVLQHPRVDLNLAWHLMVIGSILLLRLLHELGRGSLGLPSRVEGALGPFVVLHGRGWIAGVFSRKIVRLVHPDSHTLIVHCRILGCLCLLLGRGRVVMSVVL